MAVGVRHVEEEGGELARGEQVPHLYTQPTTGSFLEYIIIIVVGLDLIYPEA